MTTFDKTLRLFLLATLAGSAVVPTAQAGARPIRVRHARGGYYIVVLKPLVFADDGPEGRRAAVASEVQRLMGALPDGLVHTYSNAISGFSGRMSRSWATRIARDPTVDYVISDSKVKLEETAGANGACTRQEIGVPWGLDRIDERALPLNNAFQFSESGRGVHVYVLDTGTYAEHSEFGGRAAVAFDATGGNGIDCNGHGTHVAATIAGSQYGVAKNASVYGIRVLGCSGSGYVSDIIEGIDWVTGYHLSPAVANMSLGTSPGAEHQALDDAVRRSIASGVTYVVAAGNSRTDAVRVSPARVGEAVTVGASTDADTMTSFSNYGNVVDVFAPGQNVLSAWTGSPTAWAVKSGTSMSAPHVSGAAAALLEKRPQSTPAEIEAAIRANATSGALGGIPAGTANLLLYSPRVCETTTTTTIVIDADGDGEPAGTDCDDSNPNVRHGLPEYCGNGLDDDCIGGDASCPPPPPPPPPVGLCYLECWKNNGTVSINDQTRDWCANFWHPVCEGGTWGGIKNKYWRQNGTSNFEALCHLNCN